MGYRLFLAGVVAKAGELNAKWGERELFLKHAAPGTFFALFGTIIIAATVWKGLDFQHELTNRNSTTATQNGGFDTQPTSKPISEIMEKTNIGGSDRATPSDSKVANENELALIENTEEALKGKSGKDQLRAFRHLFWSNTFKGDTRSSALRVLIAGLDAKFPTTRAAAAEILDHFGNDIPAEAASKLLRNLSQANSVGVPHDQHTSDLSDMGPISCQTLGSMGQKAVLAIPEMINSMKTGTPAIDACGDALVRLGNVAKGFEPELRKLGNQPELKPKVDKILRNINEPPFYVKYALPPTSPSTQTQP